MIVDETRTFNKGKSPVRISQIPNSTIPRFLPAKLLVKAMGASPVWIALLLVLLAAALPRSLRKASGLC